MKKNLIKETSTLREALGRLNELSGSLMTLIAVDDELRMTGTLTDGDVRRALLRGASLDSKVKDAMHTAFQFLPSGNCDVAKIKQAREKGIELLPVIDNEGHIERLLDISGRRTFLPVQAVLMAGGRGERLRPMTDFLPKPLLPINGKAIIDYNIEALANAGITDITVATRYMADKIAEHFANPVAGVKVKCVVEKEPLGTIGALSLIERKDPEGLTLVMNSDLLTTVSFEEMYLTHIERKADITIGVIPYTVSVPYAILETEDKEVTGISEKPTYTHYANAGIYLISNRLLDDLEPGERTDATDFIEYSINRRDYVTYYPINGTWIDVGTHTDFAQAEELMRHLHNFKNNDNI